MQNSPEIQDLLIDEGKTIKDALIVIEKNAQGICFVTQEKKLIGVLTDGDIRRSLLDGKSIESSVSDIMQKQFTYLHVNTSQEKIQEKDDDLPKNNKELASFLYGTVAENNNKIKKIQNRF